MIVLVTGATGKVGQVFLDRFLGDPRWANATVRALVHNRTLAPHPRVESVHGSISDRAVVAEAMAGVTHVVHMATVKETPDLVMDVSIKGMFWLLEEFRSSPSAQQFILIGGDCSVGHIIVPYDAPITETSPRRSYPGCYALSKVMEEVMLEQYVIQYGIDGVILRAPWIMEKDDFKHVLSFGEDQFGGPSWDELMRPEERHRYAEAGLVPVLMDARGRPLKRNFVHVEDLVAAMLAVIDNPVARGQLFNIAMTQPIDYAAVAEHLQRTRGMTRVVIASPFHSNALDNAKARLQLDWVPKYDLAALIDEAFGYERRSDDPRKVWYMG